MSEDKLDKKAAQQALYEFRKEHAKADLIETRNTLLNIIRDDKATRIDKIKACQELNKAHGGHTPTGKEAAPEKTTQAQTSWELTPEMTDKINRIINGPEPENVS